MRRLLPRLARDRRGNFATMTALVSPVLILVTALGVDAGSFFVERRSAQNLTDLAAMTAVRAPERAAQAAEAVFADNGWSNVTVRTLADLAGDTQAPSRQEEIEPAGRVFVTPGAYSPDPQIAAGQRFVAGAQPANAVRVEFESHARRYFSASLVDAPLIRTAAVASMVPKASFSIGSRLASLEGGVANMLLAKLLGANISLNAMDYRALLDTDVGLLAFVEQLGVQADLTAATYDELLAAEVAMRDVLRALSQTPGVGLTARTVLQRLASGVPASRTLPLRRLLDPGTLEMARIDGIAAGLDAVIGAVPLLNAAAALANGSNQVTLDLGNSVPGLLDLTATVAIGEPPQGKSWFALGPAGSIVRTVQTRIRLDARIGPLLGVGVHVPLFVDVAHGEARLQSASCPTGRPESARAGVEAKPGIVELHLAEADAARMHDFSRAPHLKDARLLHVPILLTVNGRAHAAATNMAADTLQFSASDVSAGTVKTVRTRNTLQTLSGSLLSNLRLEVKPLGLGLGIPPGLTGTLGGLVGDTLGAVDPVLDGLLAALGISLGEADIRVHHVDCGRPVLVQ
ncbi:TadG family pilus assembly protein [Mesorhizobium sp. YIM 152430]|uniref:pilus assembly protein TadG-related protein n=1 Tax=Mesorhizobium sp. YIM 152430 TaxID=3031761 RepID=UPI0023DC2AB6|nr:pilus assembly protein TadG-related protein [Mesorhizobium sp. YIM 152430]MDF1601268.1 TadG family pilus assembly protein [Mesorhizobium sp. YIM 152430]